MRTRGILAPLGVVRSISLLILLGLALPIRMQGQFMYTVENGSITITSGYCPVGEVIIPETINGLPVSSIGAAAFSDCTGLTNVTIPNSVTVIRGRTFMGCTSLTSVTIGSGVTSIGDGAFSGCGKLTRITIPDGLTSIGSGAFSGCGDLKSITIPNSVTSIGNGAFAGWTSLTSIAVDALNGAYSSLDGVLFDKSQTLLVKYPGGKAGAYTIPNSVSNIGEGAFEYCAKLTSVTIPNGVTNISDSAFSQCLSLSSVTIPNSVTSIGDRAFISCPDLKSIIFGGNAPGVGGSVFYGTEATIYHLPDSTGWGEMFGDRPTGIWDPTTRIAYTTDGNTVTIGHTCGEVLVIPDAIAGLPVTSIERDGFSSCTSLTSLSIPNSVTNIADGVFSGCTSLSAITVDPLNPVYSSVDGVLYDRARTTLIRCPPGRLGAFTVPATVANVGGGAFSGCTRLTNVTIGNSVASISYSAFSGCSSLTSITIPESVTSIQDWAFADCTSLTAITVDPLNPVYSSVDGVLFDESQTTLIRCPPGKRGVFTVPATVGKVVGPVLKCDAFCPLLLEPAFGGCANLTGIYFQDNVPILHDHFPGVEATIYYLPGTTGWDTDYLDAGQTALWLPQVQTSHANFGVQSNGFGFTISWASDKVVVVEAADDLTKATWTPVSTNTLAGGTSYFSDPEWAKYPSRFYRVRAQ